MQSFIGSSLFALWLKVYMSAWYPYELCSCCYVDVIVYNG